MKKESLIIIILFLLTSFISAATCIDSDLGNNLSTPGGVYGIDSSGQNYNLTDFCTVDLVDSLVEYSCNLNGEAVSTTFECSIDTICSYGACVSKEKAGKCTDSDLGEDPFVKGEISGYDLNNKDYEFSDSCSDVYLTEYYCNNGVESESMIWDCSPKKCINGACINYENMTNQDDETTKESIPSLVNSWKYLSFVIVLITLITIVLIIFLINLKKHRNF
jgi:hypothetical protein